jgi:hypothetical protein
VPLANASLVIPEEVMWWRLATVVMWRISGAITVLLVSGSGMRESKILDESLAGAHLKKKLGTVMK